MSTTDPVIVAVNALRDLITDHGYSSRVSMIRLPVSAVGIVAEFVTTHRSEQAKDFIDLIHQGQRNNTGGRKTIKVRHDAADKMCDLAMDIIIDRHKQRAISQENMLRTVRSIPTDNEF